MRKISALIFILFVFAFSISNIYGVPAYPFPIKLTQPDGTQITVRMHGDEFFHYRATLDGYPLVSNKEGILTYAKLDDNGNLVSTDFKATNIEKRSAKERKFLQTLTPNPDFSRKVQAKQAARALIGTTDGGRQKVYPLTGSPKSLVILVNFSNKSFVTANAKTSFTNLLNQTGYSTNGGTGSARDYFRDNSMGVFNPEFDVVGPYTLPQTMEYYGGNDSSGNDLNPQQMVIDACSAASAAGVNFAQYDTDNNGVVDNVFIYYAGFNEAEDNSTNKVNASTIWPHRWSLNNMSTKFNGVSVYGYACTSELKGYSGSNMCGIGTFTHEFGHVLGLDDMYATNGDTHHTLSLWDIMDYGPYLNGGRTPCGYSSYERFFLNWLVPTELTITDSYTLDTLSTKNKAYLISQTGNHNLNGANPSPVEFFMLENRQQKGWDRYLPGHGMLVTHIYYNASTWANNTPNNDPNAMGVDIVEADGIALAEVTSIDGTLSGDPFPGTNNVTAYNPILRNITNIKKPLTNITETNGIIRFNFGTKITLTQSLQPFSTIQGTPSASQTVTVSGKKLKAPLVVGFRSGLHFELKKESDPETAWSKSLSFTPATDSTVAATNIQIRYNPTVPSYSSTHNEILTATSGTSDLVDATLSGTSTRAVYVVTPVAINATDTTYTSFAAKWNSVFDATGYYLTVYNFEDGSSSLKEGFTNGLAPSQGWTITAKTTSSASSYSGTPPSIQFSNNGEYVETEKYLSSVTGLSFYIHSLGGNYGGLTIRGLNNQNNWEKIDSIPVVSSLWEKNKTYTLAENKGYTRFRFTYTKGIGSVTLDDVQATFSKKLNYVLKDSWVTANHDTLNNLTPNTEYFYQVRASDKSIYYENITGISNTISAKTLPYPSTSKLQTKIHNDGSITVYLPSIENYTLRIYNLLGQCCRIVVPDKTTFTVTDLPGNQVYILKANNLVSKIFLK